MVTSLGTSASCLCIPCSPRCPKETFLPLSSTSGQQADVCSSAQSRSLESGSPGIYLEEEQERRTFILIKLPQVCTELGPKTSWGDIVI